MKLCHVRAPVFLTGQVAATVRPSTVGLNNQQTFLAVREYSYHGVCYLGSFRLRFCSKNIPISCRKRTAWYKCDSESARNHKLYVHRAGNFEAQPFPIVHTELCMCGGTRRRKEILAALGYKSWRY